jgi:hypothetical protein
VLAFGVVRRHCIGSGGLVACSSPSHSENKRSTSASAASASGFSSLHHSWKALNLACPRRRRVVVGSHYTVAWACEPAQGGVQGAAERSSVGGAHLVFGDLV